MSIFKNKNNRHKSEKITSYNEFKKDAYTYRVEEILENIVCNDKEYIKLKEESRTLYKTLRDMLDTEEQAFFRRYVDAETGRQSYEAHSLAEQIYEDLER